MKTREITNKKSDLTVKSVKIRAIFEFAQIHTRRLQGETQSKEMNLFYSKPINFAYFAFEQRRVVVKVTVKV